MIISSRDYVESKPDLVNDVLILAVKCLNLGYQNM